MRLLLTLHSTKEKQSITINYQYPIASAIYRILKNADAEYAAFLHEKGYGKGFKLFTFSDIKCPFKIQGDRLILLTDKIELVVCFHLPEAAETFIKGIFISQQIDIADKKSKATFIIEQVSSLASPLEKYKNDDELEVLLRPLSPIVCGLKNENGIYTFLSPEDDRYEEMLFSNWHEKVKAIYESTEADYLMKDAFVEIIFLRNPPKSRLLTIKAFTTAETKIRGFVNFNLRIRGRREVVELLLNSGVGLYNAQGMGCVGVEGIEGDWRRDQDEL
ncbi:MAG: CRISPR-associated endoribonuclease Cas6 [Ginsengibacter sp.]